MPLYNLVCPKCSRKRRLLVFALAFDKVQPNLLVCDICGCKMNRDASGVTSAVKETLDNGVMPRAVERFADIEETMKERHRNADPLAGRKNFS